MLHWFENILSPFPDTPISPPPRRFFAFVWACTEGLRVYLFAMTLLTMVIGAFEALLFAMMGKIVDRLSQVSPSLLWSQEHTHLILLAVILMLSTGLVSLHTFIKHQTLAGNFPMRLRWNFHRLMLSQSMDFFQDEFAGRVSAKVMQTALAVREMWFILADIMVYVTIYFATLVGVVGSFHPWMMLPFMGWLACYSVSLVYFIPRLSEVSQSQADARAMMTGRITDAYANIATVKLFSHAGREAGYAKSAMQDFVGVVHKQMRYVSAVEILNHFLNMTLIVLSGGAALWLWAHGEVGAGGVAAVTAMALRLNGISHWVMWEMTSLFEQVGTVQDGINTLSLAHTVQDKPDAQPLTVTRGEIRFEQVGFAYTGAQRVLDHFSLTIRPGEKIGLVGRSGAGKSTIVNLLLRFYDLQEGRILIDGQDIVLVKQDSLRANIGMVTQDTSLLHRSVRENILYGKPDATDEEMRSAALRAEAHGFVETLRDPLGNTGYEAHVGERGVKLSGGQRQRIAIARVMLKDAPILLLDEATSALDSEVEAAIQGSLYQLMEGKTVVAIAHRLSTIAAMDRLIVLDKGRIVEEGDHATLLRKGGLYARLWAHQSGGFLGEDLDEQEVEEISS
ncbi:ATP-binding cassette, subfamily B, multidrug efflux pump [Novimethylophilus kurashikiensis]|uniref:ATP-binding cassette, subfamily B, multidrug efflux pump n=1 Tax=Novimethylophilus kurashikiensis TaxID=1825523 RepID=A0A2R5FDB6_9PROT|nr:ABC transporter ATP-binding protein [Novimethylophilus kurashikiensis]GBG15799.1 ATP-binding cassette, subfamily B, multidrug efflux pump [Novimethylophilus kurashikiensis]